MARSVFNVIIDRVISSVRVKVRDDSDSKTWEIDSSTGCGSVAVKSLKPDGAHSMPAGDDKSRPVFGKMVESAPTDSSKNNASLSFTWTNGKLTGVAMGIGASSYARSITWSGNQIASISAWS